MIFLLNWGYFTLFEAFGNGRTPGKRVAKIRVIQRSGRPIGLFESLARNLIRYVDQIPVFYAVGVIVMFVTQQHQRLGDLAAGTLVVRDREQESTPWAILRTAPSRPRSFLRLHHAEPHSFISAARRGRASCRSADLEVLEGFFSRRLDMSLATRQALAERIASAIQAKSGLERPPGVSVETFLEAPARELRDLGRMR